VRIEPRAHDIDPAVTVAAPTNGIAPAPSTALGPIRTATPTKPSANPTIVARRGMTPLRSQSNSSIHAGMRATVSATTFDGTVCSV